MTSDDELKVRRLNSGMTNQIERDNKQHNTINIGQNKLKNITPKNERKYSQEYFYETFNKIMYDKEIKLLNKEAGNDFKIIILKRDKEDESLHQDKNDHLNQMINLPAREYKEYNQNESCDLESNLNSFSMNKCSSIMDFKAKFIIGISQQTPFQNQIKNSKEKVVQKNENTSQEHQDTLNNDTIICINEQDNIKSPIIDSKNQNEQLQNINITFGNSNFKIETNSIINSDFNELRHINNKPIDDEKNKPKNPFLHMTKPTTNSQREEIQLNTLDQGKENYKEYETEFTFSSEQKRKYKRKDIITKKDFFQMRYLNQNLKNIPKLANMFNNKNSLLQNNTQKNFYFYIDNRNVIKYISLFFKKIETAIFQFNTRKYDKAYHSLLNDNIIYNENEFGEVLLLIQGFDKAIIGEFLSSEKTPNEKQRVTKGLIAKLDFKNEEFIPCFQFYLSLFILPKENTGVLLGYFSSHYYNENIEKDFLYKNESYVQTLCNVTIEANNLITKQHKTANKEEFIKLHSSNIDREMCGFIYDEIKKRSINIPNDNYNEEIYKKLFKQSNYNLTPLKQSIQNPAMNSGNKTIHYSKIRNQKQNECELSNSDLIALLKQGAVFKQKKKDGTLIERLVYLNEDEREFLFENSSCSCGFSTQRTIPINKVIKVYRGTSSIKNRENDNYISLILKRNTIELFNADIKTIVKWFHAFSYLIKQNQPSYPSRITDQNISNNYFSIYWSEIVNNWIEYRDVLKLKNTKSFSLSAASKSNRNHNIYQSNSKLLKITKEEAAILWSYGLPKWIRNSLWKIILSDKLDICENLLLTYQRTLQEEIVSLNNNTKTSNAIKEMISEINEDINELYNKYYQHIQIKEEIFKDELYIIIRGFCLYRPDIIYSLQIAYFAMIFYLNANSYFEAFVFLCNFIVPNCFFQFSLQDEVFASEYTNFFNFLLEKHLINVYQHFNKFGINSSIFFLNWVGYLYATTFEYETVLRIWDNYLLKGNTFIFELAIAIVNIQEKTLLNSSISSILNNLKYFPKQYSEKELFEIINRLNITDDFEEHFDQNEIGKEKGKLYQVYLN